MTFTDRLNKAMKIRGINQSVLGDAVGISQSSIWKLTSGLAKSSRKVVEIANVLNVDPNWLARGEGEMDSSVEPSNSNTQSYRYSKHSDSYVVEVLDVTASAGMGLINNETIDAVRSIEYSNYQAAINFGNKPARNIKAISVRGDSMQGTIEAGDLAFVDISVNSFDGDGIYVFVFDKSLFVKRLQMIKGLLKVKSDNQKYDTWDITEAEQDRLFIQGKVLLSQSMEHRKHG